MPRSKRTKTSTKMQHRLTPQVPGKWFGLTWTLSSL